MTNKLTGLFIFVTAAILFVPYCIFCVITGKDWLGVWE